MYKKAQSQISIIPTEYFFFIVDGTISSYLVQHQHFKTGKPQTGRHEWTTHWNASARKVMEGLTS